MNLEFEITGQDSKKAGEASFEVKHRLKRLGLLPHIIRRVATAAYEAELNVIIYAQRGKMKFCVEDKCVDVIIAEVGPGIPDIELAMQEGYTTAPRMVNNWAMEAGWDFPIFKRTPTGWISNPG